MIPHSPGADLFKQQLYNSLKRQTTNIRAVKFARNENVYSAGDENGNIYFVESGQVKLMKFSPTGKECLLAIYSAGDVFGEACLVGSGERGETATAMNETVLRAIPCAGFFSLLTADSLFEEFIRYQAARVAEHQEMISSLVTAGSEQRLGKTLLLLARKAGRQYARSSRFTYRITHEELSAMIGTTRPRVSKFMRRFQQLGLIVMSTDKFIVVKEKDLADYLQRPD